METNRIILGDCIEKLNDIESNKIDLIYLDPPFFTQKRHSDVVQFIHTRNSL